MVGINKTKTTIAIDNELLAWIKEMVKLKRFANITHAIEYALQRLKEKESDELHTPDNTVVTAGLFELCSPEAQHKD